MDKEQLDYAVEWINEGKSLEDWLRVNGYKGELREEVKTEIEAALSGSSSTSTPEPEVEDDEDWDEDEDWEDEDEDED